jgi:hypothetical protein
MANKNFRCFPVGKLPIQALRRLLELNRIVDPRVLVGPGIGEDAAVIDTGGPRFLIAKSDPITFAVDRKKSPPRSSAKLRTNALAENS